MAGIIKISSLTDVDTSKNLDAQYITDGTAKAWANLDGTGTIAGRDSLNISSYDDNGTGDYDFNFTASFSDANRTPTFSANDDQGTNAFRSGFERGAPAAGEVPTRYGQVNSAAADDVENAYMAVMGDLA